MHQAIVIGATGLVGTELVKKLSLLYQHVVIVVRKAPNTLPDNVSAVIVENFAHLSLIGKEIDFTITTDAFSCLGTTKKQAGSKKRFKEVDFGYNYAFAQICKEQGVTNFFLLSSLGARSTSPIFYSKVKGELEDRVKELGFKKTLIFQPSLLIGKREGRILESLSQNVFAAISPLLTGKNNLSPIKVESVANAIALMSVCVHKEEQQSNTDDICKAYEPVTVVSNREMLSITK